MLHSFYRAPELNTESQAVTENLGESESCSEKSITDGARDSVNENGTETKAQKHVTFTKSDDTSICDELEVTAVIYSQHDSVKRNASGGSSQVHSEFTFIVLGICLTITEYPVTTNNIDKKNNNMASSSSQGQGGSGIESSQAETSEGEHAIPDYKFFIISTLG